MADISSDILIEGLRPDEFLRLPMEDLQSLIFRDKPVVFKAPPGHDLFARGGIQK